METLVLCPEELCLGPIRLTASGIVGLSPVASDFSIWTNTDVEKGTRFLPWKGTVRGDKLPVYDKLSEYDVRHRFGLYDEVSESPSCVGGRLRQCNWIRFLRHSLVYNQEVNVVATKGPTGEPVFDMVKDVGPKTELVAFFVPERPEEAFLLPAIQYLRHTLFKRLVDNVLEESPLDLSTSLVMSKVAAVAAVAASAASPAHSVEGRKSVSSDCTTCTETSETSTSVAVSVAERHRSLSTAISFSTPSRTRPTTSTTSSSPTTAIAAVRRREKNMLPCTFCGKAFDRPSLLKRHVRIHTGERPHVCDVCSKGFSTSSSLNTHRRIHSGEKPHQCGVCGKRFTASSNLYYHKMTHIKEKPHKCSMCSKSFPTPGDLKSHTYVHTGTWPFKCHICHRGFSKQTNLKNHLLLHSGDKPFNCEICQKKFALSCNLRAHLKTHEAEYQSSAASLALYRRALAALGSQELTPNADSPSCDEDIGIEDEEDELLDIEDDHQSAEEDENPRPSSISSNNNNSKNNNNHSLSDFAKHMALTV